MQIAPGPGQTFAVPPAACLVVFSLSNEPWLKYSLALVADQGTDRERWTSTRLRREGLYIESATNRYELALAPANGSRYDKYTLSEVLAPHDMDARAVEAAGVPLPRQKTTLLEESLDWEVWTTTRPAIPPSVTCYLAASCRPRIVWAGAGVGTELRARARRRVPSPTLALRAVHGRCVTQACKPGRMGSSCYDAAMCVF